MHGFSPHRTDARYRQRLLASLAGVLAAALVLVHGWPDPSASSSPDLPFSSRPAETIQIEEVPPTSQSLALNPPPPAPLPPVVVPNDVLIEEPFEITDSALPIEEPGEDARSQVGTAQEPVASRVPDTNARLLRAVQPQYPESARRDGLEARVRVSVQVDASGRVTDARIVDRWVLRDGRALPTARLGHGLDDAALAAARRSRFRPARNAGTPVPTQTTITFTFGE